MSILDRLSKNISPEPNSGCWLWMGHINPGGYGRIWRDGALAYTHRVMYELTYGPIPNGLQIDHLCRVRCCVNPQHLEAVTAKENLLRSPIAGPAIMRNKTHCPAGHPYDTANTYHSNGKTKRFCRACVLNNNRRYLQRKRQGEAGK